uniref:CCHC-type domain-containing protein n=1 Tax=Tanacetum cinerariifolium TaxID=118510 RepID=A0A6L2J5A7_TANCI|nr:hypothetical protein [Tanacetum cinerariifolium]
MNDIKEELKRKYKKDEVVRRCGIRLEKADTGKEVAAWDPKCYNCWKQGHYSRNYPTVKVRNKAYFKEKMLAATEEKAEHADVPET